MTDQEKAECFNLYFQSVFGEAVVIPEITEPNEAESFQVQSRIIRKRIQSIGMNKSVSFDGISGELLKIGGNQLLHI